MSLFTVACLNYEICGAEETFDSVEEYEIYGDEQNPRYTSEALSDHVNIDPDWGADAIIDMWSEHEEMLLDLADITKPNSSKGEHSHVQ